MLNLTVTEVRDRQRDEREPILALVGVSTRRCSIPAICGFFRSPPMAAASRWV
jgi:hypothetical protein